MQIFGVQILGGAYGGPAAAVFRNLRRDLAFRQGHSANPVVSLLLTKCDPTDIEEVRICCLPSRPHDQRALPANPGAVTHSVTSQEQPSNAPAGPLKSQELTSQDLPTPFKLSRGSAQTAAN